MLVENIKYTFTQTDVKVFTLWGSSTENAKNRSKDELDFLMNMYKLLDDELDKALLENKINFRWVGDPDGISDWFKQYLEEKTQMTKCDSDRFLVFAIHYWWRDEIIKWIKKMSNQNYNFSSITEEDLWKNLWFGDLPPIELVIRTKWNYAQRTSWFMSWWIGYAELYFTEKKSPEFNPDDLKQALNWFDDMSNFRNFGK